MTSLNSLTRSLHGRLSGSGSDRPRLIQYWDDPKPPEDVARLMASWEGDPAFAYAAFDRSGADAFIAERFDAETSAAFRRCAVPAMQADVLRYCALFELGGAYLDADTSNRGGLAELVAPVERAMLVARPKGLINGIMYFRGPGDPLLERVIGIVVRDIGQRIPGRVWSVTGPGVLRRLLADPAERALFEGIDIVPLKTAFEHVQHHTALAYQEDATDWRNFGGTDIYREP